jgi:hypothetical protein
LAYFEYMLGKPLATVFLFISLLSLTSCGSPSQKTGQEKTLQQTPQQQTSQQQTPQQTAQINVPQQAQQTFPPEANNLPDASTLCKNLKSNFGNESLQFSNLKLEKGKFQGEEVLNIIGCVTNKTTKNIALVDFYYDTKSPKGGSGGGGSLMFSELAPGKTVAFKTNYNLELNLSEVAIKSFNWQGQGTNDYKQVPSNFVLTQKP